MFAYRDLIKTIIRRYQNKSTIVRECLFGLGKSPCSPSKKILIIIERVGTLFHSCRCNFIVYCNILKPVDMKLSTFPS